MSRLRSIALGALLWAGVGCAEEPWYTETFTDAYWSDDDSQVLVVIHRAERREEPRPWRGSDIALRNATLEIRAVALNDRSEGVLVPRQGGQVRSPFFMHRAGYLYYEHLDDGVTRLLRSEDGTTRQLPGGVTHTVPSPSGEVLLEISPCHLSAGGETCAPVVGFRDVDSLRVLATVEPVFEDEYALPLGIWISESEAVVWNPGVGTAFFASIDGTLTPGAETPPCYSPGTTSSPFAADGREVSATLSDGRIVLEIGEADGVGFPERCWPGGS